MAETYNDIVLRYLEEYGEISHRKILEITNTNCPYGVIRNLRKKGYNITDKTFRNESGKTYKIFYYTAPPKKPEVKELTPLNQLSLGLIIKKTELSALEMRQKYGM